MQAIKNMSVFGGQGLVIRRDLLHPLGQLSTRTDCLENLSVSILQSFQHPTGLRFE